jgi:hypothetical protein
VYSPSILDEPQRPNESPVPQSEEGSGEETLSGTILRERLAALGTSVQLEKRFARGEKQGKSWNKSIDATARDGDSRTEMLEKFFDPELEDQARPDSKKTTAPPKKDVFGRPISE